MKQGYIYEIDDGIFWEAQKASMRFPIQYIVVTIADDLHPYVKRFNRVFGTVEDIDIRHRNFPKDCIIQHVGIHHYYSEESIMRRMKIANLQQEKMQIEMAINSPRLASIRNFMLSALDGIDAEIRQENRLSAKFNSYEIKLEE